MRLSASASVAGVGDDNLAGGSITCLPSSDTKKMERNIAYRGA
ncbi:MAG: hypothetical protein ACK5PO_04155 [Bacteroidota bacterium]